MSDRKPISEIDEYFLQKPGFHTRGIVPFTIYDNTHAIYKMTLQSALSLNIVNWKYNRPPDMIRCAEIAGYYRSVGRNLRMDSTFHLHLNTTDDCFEVIDGIHRWTALLELHREFQTDADPQKTYYWFYNTTILVSIRKDMDQMKLAQLFQLINKSVSVPFLYTEPIDEVVSHTPPSDDEPEETETVAPMPMPMPNIQLVFDKSQYKRQIIEDIVLMCQRKYKLQFSANDRCHRPNINRDRLMDILDEIWKVLEPFCDLNDMEHEMNEIFEAVNEYAKSLVENSGDHVSAKLKKSGGYIFTMDKNNIVYWAQILSKNYA